MRPISLLRCRAAAWPPGQTEHPRTAAVRALFAESTDASAAGRAMPKHMAEEHARLQVCTVRTAMHAPMHALADCRGLQALGKHGPAAWLQVALAIPRSIRTMCMHVVQICLWNRAASARLRMHGCIAVGDLTLQQPLWRDGGVAGAPLAPHACTAGGGGGAKVAAAATAGRDIGCASCIKMTCPVCKSMC
jgi:hypothetical protein